MEEIKEIVNLLKELPALAIWVLALFFAYKVICVGSIYGVIKFCVTKLHSYLVSPKTVRTTVTIEHLAITSCYHDLLAQLGRIKSKGTHLADGTGFIHRQSVDWLRCAIDAQEAKDLEAAK